MQFCDLDNKGGRQSKNKQASRGLSSTAELLASWVMPNLHRRHGQDETRQCCLVRVSGVNWV